MAFTVAANTTTASRTGKLTIAGQTFTVSQSGAPIYILLPSPDLMGQYLPAAR